MPRPLPFRPDPAPPPPGLHSGDGQVAHDAARDAQFDRLRQVEHDTEEPRSHGAELADQMTDQLRALIRHTIGPAPWVQAAYPARVLSMEDRTRRRCTVQLLESGGVIDNVQADPTNPTVGGQYAVRRTVRLNPAATRGAPEEVHWTLKVPSSFFLYWFDLTRNPGFHTLLKTPWPLEAEPTADTIEEVFRWSRVPTFGGLYTTTALLGIDGEGTVFAERGGHTVANVRDTFTVVATAPLEASPPVAPVEHLLPMVSATGGVTLTPHRTNLFLMRAQALATGGAGPGIVVGMLPSVSLLLNPTLGVYDATSNDTLNFSLSTDGGASWTLRTSVPYQPAHWQARVDEPSQVAIYSNWYFVPAGRLFAWIAADSAEATALATPSGSVGWVAGMTRYGGALVGLGSHPGGFDLDYELGGFQQGGAFTAWTTGRNRFGMSTALLLGGAGVESSGAYRILRAASGTPPTWVQSTAGVGGPWAAFATPAGSPALEMVGLDRTFTQGLVAYSDNDTGLLTSFAATVDGATWEPLTPAQQAFWATTLYPDTAARAWIVAS